MTAGRPGIPTGRASLTTGWFNAVFGSQPSLAIPEISSIQLDDSVVPGMMSDVVRIIVRYVGDTGPSDRPLPGSFIVKLSARGEAMRTRPATRLSYLKEVRFYQQLAENMSLPCARCYYADVDAQTGDHVLVLEDLAPGVGRPLADGCSLEEAELAVVWLARLHGRWWDSAQLDDLTWLPEPAPLDPAGTGAQHRRWWPEFLDIAGERLSPQMRDYGAALGGEFARLMNQLLFSAPRTLRHGDYSLSNMLFDAGSINGEGSEPRPFVVIDWQMLARGKGPWDLAWFLGQSLTVVQRRAWEGDLLTLYHSSLLAQGVRGYDFEHCLLDYRRAIGQRFGTIISSVVALPFSASQKAEILNVQLPRNAAAISDHGGLAILDGI